MNSIILSIIWLAFELYPFVCRRSIRSSLAARCSSRWFSDCALRSLGCSVPTPPQSEILRRQFEFDAEFDAEFDFESQSETIARSRFTFPAHDSQLAM